MRTKKFQKPVDESFPAYPQYPESEDIYSKAEKIADINPDDNSKLKDKPLEEDEWNEKAPDVLLTGEDLDIPDLEELEQNEDIGEEDEENSYYSLGGDEHNDLEESN
jgi:hypothetical protein